MPLNFDPTSANAIIIYIAFYWAAVATAIALLFSADESDDDWEEAMKLVPGLRNTNDN